MSRKKSFGQYFTPAEVADFMVSLSSVPKKAQVLEPSAGEGIFLSALQKKGFKNILGYEVDTSLSNISNAEIIYKSFLSEDFRQQFDLIIGNPPYIRWKNLNPQLKDELSSNVLWNTYFNSLCDYLYIFILKSIKLLKEGGELIFICPEYWLNTTHSISLRNFMVENGYFQEIYHFNETPVFNKVTVSIIIFKFVKKIKHNSKKIQLTKYYSRNKLSKEILNKLRKKTPLPDVGYFEIEQFKANERWILASDEIKQELKIFEGKCSFVEPRPNLFEEKISYHTIGEICDIGNGLVSGLDKAFQLNGHPLNLKEMDATMQVIKAKDLKPYFHGNITRYIFIKDPVNENKLREDYPAFYSRLKNFKPELEERYNYNREIKYWEWVFLRNFSLFNKKTKKIFVPCKERISNKNYFRFALVEPDIFPTQDVTALVMKENVRESIYYILAMLNNHRTFNWLKYNGIVKGNIVEFSEKPVSNIPVRLINWENLCEVDLHNEISAVTEDIVSNKRHQLFPKLESLINCLF